MSEQIREQVSAFLDGELPTSETELLLKRLTRDGELRESFGRFALIGEAVRGAGPHVLTRGFASRVNLAIDGEPVQATSLAQHARAARWWRPLAGVTVAAGVATVAIVALQQRAISPGLRGSAPAVVQNVSIAKASAVPREALSYTVPAASNDEPSTIAPARLTQYVFAHSRYSSGLGQRGVLADLLIEDDEAPQLLPVQRVAQPSATPDTRIAP
ncbi:MAG TPA: RseA family anti-sigma factor [Steroidobacteraceae bacterium]|jgi:sigma-E factor negative regulatory protein RseA|nr:RseA family anti-sigma factor [Steroidobacteraceae bacterium]